MGCIIGRLVSAQVGLVCMRTLRTLELMSWPIMCANISGFASHEQRPVSRKMRVDITEVSDCEYHSIYCNSLPARLSFSGGIAFSRHAIVYSVANVTNTNVVAAPIRVTFPKIRVGIRIWEQTERSSRTFTSKATSQGRAGVVARCSSMTQVITQ